MVRKGRDSLIPEELYYQNENLVRFVLKKSFYQYLFDDDYLQIGRIGLWRACQSYDEAKGKFSTYASMCIANEIRMNFRKTNRRASLKCVSADSDISDTKGLTLKEKIVGDKDVLFFDFDGFIGSLAPKEKTITESLMRGKTQKDIGRDLGISQPQISRLLKSARKKFNEYI